MTGKLSPSRATKLLCTLVGNELRAAVPDLQGRSEQPLTVFAAERGNSPGGEFVDWRFVMHLRAGPEGSNQIRVSYWVRHVKGTLLITYAEHGNEHQHRTQSIASSMTTETVQQHARLVAAKLLSDLVALQEVELARSRCKGKNGVGQCHNRDGHKGSCLFYKQPPLAKEGMCQGRIGKIGQPWKICTRSMVKIPNGWEDHLGPCLWKDVV